MLGIGFLIINSKLDLYVNWNIYFPGIQRRIVIFDDFFQDGDQISIFKCYSKRNIKKIKNKNGFIKITSENIDEVQENLLNFYNGISTEGKEKYDKNINTNQIVNLESDNYYLIKREEKSYIILILDMRNKRIYTFITVRN
jgi:hypothetical protein